MKTMLRVFFPILLCVPQFIQAQCPVVNFGPDTVICMGTSIILDAENTGATYLWSDGSTTPQLETFFEGEYSVEVTLNGCVARDTIYVSQGPVIQADFNYLQEGSCSPFVTDFNEFSQACSASVIDWAWTFGDGTTSSARNPVHTYALPGDYVVTLTVKSDKGAIYNATQTITITGDMSPVVELGNDVNLCFGNTHTLDATNTGATYSWSTGETTPTISVVDGGTYSVTVTNGGCTAADTMHVVSVPVLWSDFTFQKISGCMPVKYKFTDNSTACEGTIQTWFWDFGDGTTSTLQNPGHDFNSQAQFNVKLTVTDNMGNSIRRSKRVTVVPSSMSVNLGADTVICFGSNVTLDTRVSGATYLWSTGETSQQITVGDDGDYSVSVQTGGCVAKDTIHVNTSASVLSKWSYSKGAACLPVQVTFTDSSVAYCGQSVQSWYWDFGDGTFSTEQNPVHGFASADTFIVRLTITATSGAATTTTKKIGISNTSYSVDLPSELKVCTGGSVPLDAGVADAAYLWTPSFGVSDVHAQNMVIKPMINAWYHLEVTKCMVSLKDSVYIIVDSISKPAMHQNGNILTSTAAVAYEWYRDGEKISDAKGKTLRIDRKGYYSVKIVNKSGCDRMSDPEFFLPFSGKEKAEEVIRIKCSPNPSNGKLNILVADVPDRPARLTVYDRRGRSVLHGYITGHVTPLNLMRSSKGLYYIEVAINNRKTIVPVVIQ